MSLLSLARPPTPRPQALKFLDFVRGEPACNSGGSGAHARLKCFRPGDMYAGFGDADTALPVPAVHAENAFAAEAAGVVAWSLGWKRIWNNSGGVSKMNYDVWVPTAPDGFVAIGVVCMFGCVTHSKPEDPVLCLRQSLARACASRAAKKVWDDSGTSATYDLSLGRLHHGLLWPMRATDTRDLSTLPPAFTLDHTPWVHLERDGIQSCLSSLELCLLELAAQHPFTVGLQLFWLLEVEIDRVVESAKPDAAHDVEDDGEVHGEDDKESLPVLLARATVLHQVLMDCYGSYNDDNRGINAIPALVFKEQYRLWSKGGAWQ